MAIKLKPHLLRKNREARVGSFEPMKINYHRRTPQENITKKLGSAAPSDILHNCLTCSRWASCTDRLKAMTYRCSRYREATLEATSIEDLFANPEDEPINLTEDQIFQRTGDDDDSIEEMISRVINSNVPVPPDLRINDGDIPSPKNFLHWITNDKFGKVGLPPFPRQVELGLKLYGEFCPRCTDAEWFDEMAVDTPLSEIEDRVQPLEYGVCPKCHVTKSELVESGELDDYYGLVVLAGQRAAKTSSMILWDTYNLARTLKLPSPQIVFNTQTTTVFTSTYTALTFQQAVENMWNPYLNTLKGIPWFKNYHKFLDQRGIELGEELYNLGEHMVRYRHRNMLLAPSGPSKRTMRGRTRWTAAMDEPGWYPIAKRSTRKGDTAEMERLDAKGVFDALNNSLLTLKTAHRRRVEEGYNDLPKPVIFAISSPSQYNDFIMSSYRLFQGSSEVLAKKYTTWEFNPLLKKKDFREIFRTKPVEAARDYECNPPIGEGLFITETSALVSCLRSGPNKIQVATQKVLSKTKIKMTNSMVRITSNNLPSFGTILCVDVGLVNNSFAFSIIGPPDDYDTDVLPEERGTMQTPVKVWAVGEVIPKLDTKISLTSVYTDCFIPLLEPFNIKYMVSDRWQNAKIAQDLENSYGVVPLEHKASWEDFEATRELLYSKQLIMPRTTESIDTIMETTLDNYPEVFRNRPIDHMAWQFMTVREQTGVTVLKGDGGTDDLFRTIVLGVAQMQDDEVLEELLAHRNKVSAQTPFLGMVVKMSGKGGSSGNAQTGSDGKGISFVQKMRN